jgi:hypothetical protein
MDQLIARAIDHKDRQKPAQALKAEDKPAEKPDEKNKPDSSSSTQRGASTPRARGSGRGRGGSHHNQQGNRQNCGWCNGGWYHDEANCKLKHHIKQSQAWQTINASAIEYFKKKNKGRSSSLQPKPASTPAISSTPTPMANPNVGFSARAFSTTSSTKDLNWYLDSGASYHMTPFRDSSSPSRQSRQIRPEISQATR